MNHQNGKWKLGRDSKHRKSLMYNLIRSLFLYNSIKSTLAKTKFMKSTVEKLITRAKENNLANFRYFLSFFRGHDEVVRKVFEIGSQMKERKGGYTRIIKLGQRHGDSASMALISFVGDAA